MLTVTWAEFKERREELIRAYLLFHQADATLVCVPRGWRAHWYQLTRAIRSSRLYVQPFMDPDGTYVTCVELIVAPWGILTLWPPRRFGWWRIGGWMC